MILPWLAFIAVGLITYTGFLKLAAGLLCYSVSWKASFLFAGIVLVLVFFDHVLVFSQPVAIRIGHGVMLLLGLVILGGWFFRGAAQTAPVRFLGGQAGYGSWRWRLE